MMKRKLLLVPAFVVLGLVLWVQGGDWYWRAHPKEAFRNITGRSLPNGMQAIAYASEISDNFFHRTHYWSLSGTPESFRELIVRDKFQVSEDADWAKPDIDDLFGIAAQKTDTVTGYQSDDGGRNRWFWLSSEQTTALYSY
jgi:hypothetical protein